MSWIKRIIWWGKRALMAVVLLGVGFLLGHLVSSAPGQGQMTGAMHDHAEAGSQQWYCSMHPQIVRDRPGLCPICEMDLIPMPKDLAAQTSSKWYCSMHPQIVRDGPGLCPICEMDLVRMPADLAAQSAPRELAVSEAAAKLMEIQTSSVERRFVVREVRMVGKVAYDETRVKSITAWVPGRIDRLYVDFTGTRVAAGDHLVYIYSPELVSAQAELLTGSQGVQDHQRHQRVSEGVDRANRRGGPREAEVARAETTTDRSHRGLWRAFDPFDGIPRRSAVL